MTQAEAELYERWSLHEKELAASHARGDAYELARSLIRLGGVCVEMVHPRRGTKLIAAADNLLQSSDRPVMSDDLTAIDQALAAARARIEADDDPEFESYDEAWDAGKRLSLKEAVALGRERPPPLS